HYSRATSRDVDRHYSRATSRDVDRHYSRATFENLETILSFSNASRSVVSVADRVVTRLPGTENGKRGWGVLGWHPKVGARGA
ncbi:MAG: hypothetical protein V5A21_09655, partial [Halapricum sp.]